MEISEKALLEMVDEVDELHHEGMRTMPADIAELHQGEGRRLMSDARRDFLAKASLGGVAMAIGSAMLPLRSLVSPAFAQGALDDATIAAFAESVELAAVQAYQAAAKSGKVKTAAVLTAATTFAGHHNEHAMAFGAAAGAKATHKPNPKLLQSVGSSISAAADETAVLEIAFGLENAAAATYLFALGALQDPKALQLTASILPVESQHATVLGTVLKKAPTDKKYLPDFISQDDKVDPAQFPAG
jgi:rubrerythrin